MKCRFLKVWIKRQQCNIKFSITYFFFRKKKKLNYQINDDQSLRFFLSFFLSNFNRYHSISRKKKNTQINDNPIFHPNHFKSNSTKHDQRFWRRSNKLKPFWNSVNEPVPVLESLSSALLSSEYEFALARSLAMPECPVVPFFGAFLRELREVIAFESKVNRFFKLDKLPLCTITAPWKTNLQTFSPSSIGIINYSRSLLEVLWSFSSRRWFHTNWTLICNCLEYVCLRTVNTFCTRIVSEICLQFFFRYIC